METNETDCCYHCGKILLSYVSMGTLLKLVIDEKIVFREGIDRFEKDMAIISLQSAWGRIYYKKKGKAI